jgi:prepilin-type N-terminal cleavage/methylation domain-containing protein
MKEDGFTLIELLIVVVVIGIIATIAVPRISETREQAFVAAMQADLRQLMIAQELFYQTGGFTYFEGDLPDPEFPFNATEYVTIAVTSVPSGYAATARHERTPTTCAVTVGQGDQRGVVRCEVPGDATP